MTRAKKAIRRRALMIEQDGEHPVFLFCLTGKEILQVADISRVSRNDAGELIGYQRPEVRQHIEDITAYLNSDAVLFPNAVILAMSPRVQFVRSRGPQTSDGLAISGTLEIPLAAAPDGKPAWIVDGQQRAVALANSRRLDMPVPVAAFVAGNLSIQRDQFLRINNTKPLPRGLISELLPEVETLLPVRMAATRIPSAVCEQLNQDGTSPFYGLIRRASTSKEKAKNAVLADNSVIKMVQESMASPGGVLFPFRNIATGETDIGGMLTVLKAYWTAVQNVFPDAWGLPPTESRLMHGVGIRAMGRLMDRVMGAVGDPLASDAVSRAETELALVAPACRWTDGEWDDLGGVAWNDLQNTPRHIRLLSNVLLRRYMQARSERL